MHSAGNAGCAPFRGVPSGPDADHSHDSAAGQQADVAASLQRQAAAEALGGEVHGNQVHQSHVDQDAYTATRK